jgi:hypothetical protein
MSHLYQISLSCVIGLLMCHKRLPTTDFQSCQEERGGREGGRGGVKKCFLGLRRTALLSAEGKNIIWWCCSVTRNLNLGRTFLTFFSEVFKLVL